MGVNYSPRTWITALVDALALNQEIRDPWTAIQAPWDTYAVSWSAATTQPVLGNGGLSGRFMQVGKTIDVLILLTWGSTTTGGDGTWSFSLPVSARAGIGSTLHMAAHRPGQSVNGFEGYTNVLSGSSISGVWYANPSTTGDWNVLTGTTPGSWALNDTLRIFGRYEAS